jgi:hypothetical protein
MPRVSPCLPLSLATLLPAQAPDLSVEVRAGDVPRAHAPVVASFQWPAALAAALAGADDAKPVVWRAQLVDTESATDVGCEVLALPATDTRQATGELRFVVGDLPAHAERAYRLQLGDAPQTTTAFVTRAREADTRELRAGDVPLTRVHTAFNRDDLEATSKPIWHLFVPETSVLLTKGVGGEYSHQRGLFLGWNQTTAGSTTLDFWHCRDAAQRLAGFAPRDEVQSAVRGQVAGTVHWLSPHDAIVVRDRRTVTFWRRATAPDANAPQLIDVAIELAADEPVALRGDPQHAGFQLRVADEVAQRKDARYVRPATAQGGKDDVWTDCPWVTALCTVAGRAVAVQHMSHPANPQPVSYVTRAYGRFGAYFTADLTPTEPLRLCYRLLVLPVTDTTDLSVARFARAYADFAQPPEVIITGM